MMSLQMKQFGKRKANVVQSLGKDHHKVHQRCDLGKVLKESRVLIEKTS